MGFGNIACAKQGGDCRDLGLFHQLEQFFANAGQMNAMTGQDQGTLRTVDQLSCLDNGGLFHNRPRLKTGQFNIEIVTEQTRGILDIFTNINEYHTGAPFAGNVEGFFHNQGEFMHIGDHVIVFHHRQRHPHHVGFLEGICA